MIPAEAWPKGDLTEWPDDDARIHRDFFNGTQRPYTAEENAAADARVAAAAAEATRLQLLAQLRQGVQGITDALGAADGDRATAQQLRAATLSVKTQAVTHRAQVAAFTPGAAYSAAQLAAVRDALAVVMGRQELILQALADLYDYRTANDANAVTTDKALLWIARLISGQLDSADGNG